MNDLPRNVQNLWQYSFTEMVNNAIDHSGGKILDIRFIRNPEVTTIHIVDDGEGIFNKIQRELHLSDPSQAILELKKGKLTTDPEHHSGQGIFFTSRMCERFIIYSHHLSFIHDETGGDFLFEQAKSLTGTGVTLAIKNKTDLRPSEVFEQFEDGDSGFTKTVVPVKLVAEGGSVVSRSQAKRLLARVEEFKQVILDFSEVEAIGQGFADEVFRVFARQYPHVDIIPLYINAEISRMISRTILSKERSDEERY